MKITDEMVERAIRANTSAKLFGGEPRDWVRAALTAALAEQTQQGVEELRRLDDALGNFINAYGDPYEPAEDYEAETERNIKELSDAYNGAYVAGVFSDRSALVDVPAVESEPVAWYIERNGERLLTDNDIIRDRWVGVGREPVPLYAHPPRSLSKEGGNMLRLAVKDLEWIAEFHRCYASAPYNGCYIITEYAGMAEPFSLDVRGVSGLKRYFTTLADAKSAAQADYEQRIHSALAHAPTGEDAWQPIETAPKDGTTIWVLDKLHCQPWHYECIWNGTQWYHGFGTSWPRANPTHWMHLPAPPLSTRKGSAGDGAATGTNGGQDNG